MIYLDSIEVYLDVCSFILIQFDVFGFVSIIDICLDLHRFDWIYFGLFGFIWICWGLMYLYPSSNIDIHLNPFRFFLIYLDFYWGTLSQVTFLSC